MVIIETSIFTRIIRELMEDDHYREFQEALIQQPDAGDLIPGSGGYAKSAGRWPAKASAAACGSFITG